MVGSLSGKNMAHHVQGADLFLPHESRAGALVMKGTTDIQSEKRPWLWTGNDGYHHLRHDVIPIVMGAAPEDYRRAAPHYSFIHVDEYPNPRALADYLHQLDANDNAYNEYFRWKGTGEFVNTYFWCRLCAMLHDDTRQMTTYDDVNKWWRGKDVCIGKDRWGEHADRGRYISDFYS
ncbi:FUCTA-like protein [Mya arenaria]|uniref:Fucosyltransferase n=1 Tax=Mya arenaria TaxID=6604 RepID=A0ABY7E0H3_MYAAR|nr:FUCTA-like protein [Mya arenaria]